MSIPKFDDLGNKASKLLSKGFIADNTANLVIESKTPVDPISITGSLFRNASQVGLSYDAKYALTQHNAEIFSKFATDSAYELGGALKFSGLLSKVSLSAVRTSGKQGGYAVRAGAEFTHTLGNAAVQVTYPDDTTATPIAIKANAVVSDLNYNYLAGASIDYTTAGGKAPTLGYACKVGYRVYNWEGVAGYKSGASGSTINLSLYNFPYQYFLLGATATIDPSNPTAPEVTLGFQYTVSSSPINPFDPVRDPSLGKTEDHIGGVKGRLALGRDNQLKFGLATAFGWCMSSTVSLGTEFNLSPLLGAPRQSTSPSFGMEIKFSQ